MSLEAFANYNDERAAFASLLETECTQRVLFYRGDSGSGKTSLLRACRKAIPTSVHKVLVDFKEVEINVADLFFFAADALGWERMPMFQRQLAVLNPEAAAQIDNNRVEGSNNVISQVFNINDPEERKDRQVQLTDAWLQDVRGLDRSLVLVMDTYEKAIGEVRTWVNRVLMRIPRTPPLRLVLAGQEVPDLQTSAEWVDCCCQHDLYGVGDAEHWLPVVEMMGREFPSGIENPHDYLAGICMAMEGRPADIKKWIETFPRGVAP